MVVGTRIGMFKCKKITMLNCWLGVLTCRIGELFALKQMRMDYYQLASKCADFFALKYQGMYV